MHEGRYPVFQASYGVRSSLLLQQPTTTTPAHWANHARHDFWERKVPDIKPRAAICAFSYQHVPLLARIQSPNYLPKKLLWNFIVLISCYSKSTRLWIKMKQFKSSAKSRDQNIWFTKSSETDIEKLRLNRNLCKTHIKLITQTLARSGFYRNIWIERRKSDCFEWNFRRLR